MPRTKVPAVKGTSRGACGAGEAAQVPAEAPPAATPQAQPPKRKAVAPASDAGPPPSSKKTKEEKPKQERKKTHWESIQLAVRYTAHTSLHIS